MSQSDPQELFELHPEDPLGFGLKSIAEPLQRWLIHRGNPVWERDVRQARRDLGIPEPGFEDAAGYVDWLFSRWTRHGHNEDWPVYLNIEGTIISNSESMTRYSHRDLSWPIEEFLAAEPCCGSDPMYQKAVHMAIRYGIDTAGDEPGFGNVDQAVVGYLLVNHWPPARSLRGPAVTHERVYVDAATGRRSTGRFRRQDLGTGSRGGQGRHLALWFQWWRLHRDGQTVTEIAGWTDANTDLRKTVDERTIRTGIAAVERMMNPVEKPGPS